MIRAVEFVKKNKEFNVLRYFFPWFIREIVDTFSVRTMYLRDNIRLTIRIVSIKRRKKNVFLYLSQEEIGTVNIKNQILVMKNNEE